jgi:hypothetical protein
MSGTKKGVQLKNVSPDVCPTDRPVFVCVYARGSHAYLHLHDHLAVFVSRESGSPSPRTRPHWHNITKDPTSPHGCRCRCTTPDVKNKHESSQTCYKKRNNLERTSLKTLLRSGDSSVTIARNLAAHSGSTCASSATEGTQKEPKT